MEEGVWEQVVQRMELREGLEGFGRGGLGAGSSEDGVERRFGGIGRRWLGRGFGKRIEGRSWDGNGLEGGVCFRVESRSRIGVGMGGRRLFEKEGSGVGWGLAVGLSMERIGE